MPDMEFDVNVHPAKREIRFANQNLVFLVVTHAIRETFKAAMEASSPIIDLSDEKYETFTNHSTGASSESSHTDVGFVSQKMPSQDSFKLAERKPPKYTTEDDTVQDLFSQPELGKIISLEPGQQNVQTATPQQEQPWAPPTFFQVANTYIAGEDAEGLLIIDQHAAHSRILYEQALETLASGAALESQELLFPELIEFSKLEQELFHSVEADLKHLGFYIEHFGGDTFQIRAIPSALSLSRATKAVHEFLDSVSSGDRNDMVKIQDTIAKSWAKTNAYQAGDKLKPEEMAMLVSQLMTMDDPLKSPYGTPTLMRLSLDELSKKFKH